VQHVAPSDRATHGQEIHGLALARRLLLHPNGGNDMSYTDVPPDGLFTRFERVLRRQRRLALVNLAATSTLVGGLIFALASFL
jgi:hypothetical protein